MKAVMVIVTVITVCVLILGLNLNPVGGDRQSKTICVDGVEYLQLNHAYGGHMTPHFKQDGSLYLCVNE